MVKVKSKRIYFNLTPKRLIFNIDFPKINFNFSIDTKPNQVITGILSRCEDGNDVIFLDYDKIKWKVLLHRLKLLSEKYLLQLCTIFITKETDNDTNHYSVIFYDKRPFHQVLTILENSLCDRNYIRNCEKRSSKSLVIRISPKSGRPIKYCTTIWNQPSTTKLKQLTPSKLNKELELSKAHFNFIKELFSDNPKAQEELQYFEHKLIFDKSHKINLVSYATAGK